MGVTPADPPKGYPEHWEADVVLGDGSTAHLRPIKPDDAGLLRLFHSNLSPETVYFRYFAPYPDLMEKDVQRLVTTDYSDRVALVGLVGGQIVGVGRYDRVSDTDAEIAFTVRDDFQGRGLGSVLLEHLAAAARERGLRRFVADVLPQNRRMVATFSNAGYRVAQELDEGVVKLAFEIEPNADLRRVMQGREHRAESRSAWRIFNPRGIAVIGASSRRDSLGNFVVRNLVAGGYRGRVYPIHPKAGMVAGLAAFRDVADVPGPVDLAVIVVSVDNVPDVVQRCGEIGVHALLVVSSGYSESGPGGVDRERELVAAVRGSGMRLVGPNSLGVISTDPRVQMRAALPNRVPPRGRIALYTQSAALSVAALDRLAGRRLGISAFVSTGNRADVSGHEMLHLWSEDGLTGVVLMYLESIANPSKFVRVASSCSRHKPIAIVRSGRTSQAFPLGSRPRRTELPPTGVDQLIRNAGIIETASLEQLMDVGGMLACQPLPPGRRVTVVGDSLEMVNLAADTCVTAGLELHSQKVLNAGEFAPQLAQQLRSSLTGDDTDAVLVVHIPPVISTDAAVREVLLAESQRATVPLMAVLHRTEGVNSVLSPPGRDAGHGSVPYFGTVEEAVQSLRRVADYAHWRRRPVGEIPHLPDVDPESAKAIVADRLRGRGGREGPGVTVAIVGSQLRELLACYGIVLLPSVPVSSEDEAVAAADQTGWPVAIKTTDPRLSRRGDYAGVRLNLESENALRAAYMSLGASLDDSALSRIEVQSMAPHGVNCLVSAQHDLLFGPVVSFGLSGVIPELLEDRAYQVPPISNADAARLIRAPGAASVLFGYGGREPSDLAALEDLVVRVGRMVHELPELHRLDLNPVVVADTGLAVLQATAWLQPPDLRDDSLVRRLSDG